MGHQEHGCRPEGHPRHRVPMTGVMPPPIERVLMLPKRVVLLPSCDAGSSMLAVALCMLPCTALARTPAVAVACRLRPQDHTICATQHGRRAPEHQSPALHGTACIMLQTGLMGRRGGGGGGPYALRRQVKIDHSVV